MKFLALPQLLSKKSPSNDVFLKLDFDLSHIIYRNLVRIFLHDDSFWAKSCPRMMFSWNSNLTSLNYKGHQNFGQQKPCADRTHFLYIFVLKGGGGGRCRFLSCWRKSSCVAGTEKDMRWARQRPPGRIYAATYPRRLQDENGGHRGGLRLRGERYRKLCVASNFGPQPPFFKGNNEKCP